MNNRILISLIVFGLLFNLSCRKEELTISKEKQNSNQSLNNNDIIVFGKKLENPYSVTNMKIAYELLKSENKLKSNPNIEATHYYVRFLPNSFAQLDTLEKDSTLILFDYPLDVEIVSSGSYYHDPSIPEGQVTWQYTVVPIQFQFPSIQYEILEELYLDETENNKNSDNINYEQLERQSLILTNNYNDSLDTLPTLKANWTPSGTIRCWDNVIGNWIPVVGAKVRVVNWFKVREAYTNSSGYFYTETFKKKVNYSIKWERNEYDIRSGTWGQAYTQGPNNVKTAWNPIITYGESLRYATIHRAAYRYHYGVIGGLKRPNAWSKLKYSYYHQNKDFSGINWGNWDYTGVFPDIKIWGSVNDTWVTTDDLFSTTIHETAHASHIVLMNAGEIQYVQVSEQIRESWANAVEWYITQIEYNALGVANYDLPGVNGALQRDNIQWWTLSSSHVYTPLFIDLVDNYNQSLNIATGAVMPSNRCPDGGTFDGNNCFICNTPSGESAFIYADRFYYTPVGCCSCPIAGTSYDNANCYVRSIPKNVLPLILGNIMYFAPAGDIRYPNDHVTGYTMANIESNILKHSYGLTSLREKLKANKPSGMTDKHIDFLLDFYFNL